MPTRFTGLNVYLNTSNPEKSRAFYEALGFKRLNEMKEWDTVVYDAGNGSTFIVGPAESPDPSVKAWLAHKPWGVGVVITQEVSDVEAIFERAKKISAEVELAPTDMPWGVRMLSLVDPDGYSIWFQQMTKPARPVKRAKAAKRATTASKRATPKARAPVKKAKKAAKRSKK